MGSNFSGYVGNFGYDAITIQKYVSGAYTLLSIKPFSLTKGHTYQLTLEVDGADLSLKITDTTIGSGLITIAEDTGTLNTGGLAGIHGCCLANGQSIQMSDFTIGICN